MGSGVDPSFPADGLPVVKADLRANLRHIRTELEHGGFVRLDAPGALERTTGARLDERVSIRDFGAIGDGNRHPVQGWLRGGRRDRGYVDLDAIRRDFPHVESLTDEIDWAATQAAIEAVAVAGGGWIHAPRGHYVCNRPLLFPPRATYDDRGAEVSLAGDGAWVTLFHWPVDLGPGQFALGCADREVQNEGVWQDVGLLGNADHAAVPLGAAPYGMSGFGAGARRRLVRCRASGFHAGLDLVGDHGHIADCVFNGNYFGMYVGAPARRLFGDWLIVKSTFNGAKLAAIGIHPEAQLGSATFLACYIGGAPYGILKEGGGNDQIMAHSVFVNTLFEYVGNAWIADRDDPRRGRVYRCRFELPGFSWDDRYRLPTQPRRALIDVHRLEQVEVDRPKEPTFWRPGEDAMFRLDAAVGFSMRGDLSELLAGCEAAGVPWLDGAAVATYGHSSYELAEVGQWQGRPAPAARAVRRGQLLQWQGDQVVPADGDPARPVAGVCMIAAPTGAFTVVAAAGLSLWVEAEPGVRPGHYVAQGPAGRVADLGDRDHALRIGRARHIDAERALIELYGTG